MLVIIFFFFFLVSFQIRFIIRTHPYYPRVEVAFISDFWPDLSNGIEAAYDVPEKDEALFFKGNITEFPPFL